MGAVMTAIIRERIEWLLKGWELGQIDEIEVVEGLRKLADQIQDGDFAR